MMTINQFNARPKFRLKVTKWWWWWWWCQRSTVVQEFDVLVQTTSERREYSDDVIHSSAVNIHTHTNAHAPTNWKRLSVAAGGLSRAPADCYLDQFHYWSMCTALDLAPPLHIGVYGTPSVHKVATKRSAVYKNMQTRN